MPSAQAGCIDGGCGRIDWTEVTEENDVGDALSAKLHGAFAWESSDGWGDGHPISGTLIGYIHLSCVGGKGAPDMDCTNKIADALLKNGNTIDVNPFHFGGVFSEGSGEDFKTVAPDFLHAEGTEGSTVSPSDVHLNANPFNAETCPTAFALDENVEPIVCTPACENMMCGDDGCGGSCGDCKDGETCTDGQCTTPQCLPSCEDDGGQALNCGDDGCGGSCGDCADGEECTNGMCTKNACDPICTDVACGDDGCGGSCGDCADGEVCGTDGQCAACEPSCTQENDGETITLNCGDDGCGGSCGTCDGPSICEDGVCSAVPCDAITVEGEQMCGMNGCGWDWGDCSDGQVCGPDSFCIDESGTSGSSDDSGGGCRAANGPVNTGLALVFGLALLALVTRIRRTENQ